jgi:hypothetical protein
VVNERQQGIDLETRMVHSGAAPVGDLSRDSAALAEAKAAVLERKEAASQAAGADTIHKWNDELLSLTVDLAELHARMDALKNRMDVLKKALDHAGDKQSVIDSGMKSLEDLNDQIWKIQCTTDPREYLKKEQPKLTVVESRDVPAAGKN